MTKTFTKYRPFQEKYLLLFESNFRVFMVSTAQKAYERVQQELVKVPGMIEESERRLLFKAAFNSINLPVVEFGAFFGASTLALASGLEASNKIKNQFISIDAFEVERNHFFCKYVKSYAKACNAEHLLISEGTKINWLKITEAVLGLKLANVKLVKGIVNDQFDMSILPNKIGLLHLDLPKDAATISPILQNVFPKLIKGSIIAFQDYAYQHSNELIAIFELLEERKYIQKAAIAASSIFYEVITSSLDSVDFNELLKRSLEQQLPLIQAGIKKYRKINGCRNIELIALEGAAIRATVSEANKPGFDRQNMVITHIENMLKLNSSRAAFVLSDLLTESIDPHQ